MTDISAPTLVVDIGNTLITRTQPGAFHRALSALIGWSTTYDEEFLRRTIAEAVFKASDPDTAADVISKILSLPRRQQTDLLRILQMDAGNAIIIPGAIHLLETAKVQGWRIIAATNTAGWVGPIPQELKQFINAIVSSSDVGLIKQDRNFWNHLCRMHSVDPLRCLVLGDDAVADVAVPIDAGLAALKIESSTPNATVVANWLETAGPIPNDATALFIGEPQPWAGQVVMEARHLEPLVVEVTRRPLILFCEGWMHRATLVRRRHRAPVIVMDDPGVPFPPLGWIGLRSSRRYLRMPTDLVKAIGDAGLSLGHLSTRDQQHLASLVREARNSEIRQVRISEIVSHLASDSTFSSQASRFALDYWRATCALAATHLFGFTWPPPGHSQRRRVVGHWGCNSGIAWIVGHLASHWTNEQPFLLVVGTGHAASFLFAHRAICEAWNSEKITNAAARYGQFEGDPTEIIGIPEVPYQGGELGLALSVSQSLAAYSQQSLTVCVVGDGECEAPATLAAFAHADVLRGDEDQRRKNPWLPVVNANGARMGSRALWTGDRLVNFLSGLGYRILRSGSSPAWASKTAKLALEAAQAGEKVVWISETDKGWPAPQTLAGRSMRGHFAHKPRGIDPVTSESELAEWLVSLHDGRYMDELGHIRSTTVATARCASFTPELPSRHHISIESRVRRRIEKPKWQSPMVHLDRLLADRGTQIFSPDEAESNNLNECLAAGTVREVMAESVCFGWTWGAIESGREALFASYEAFAPLVSTGLAQYGKLIRCRPPAGRPPMTILLSSLSWGNTPSHQNTDLVATVLARPLPQMRLICPVGASSAKYRMRRLLATPDVVNVVVCSKQALLDIPDPGSFAISLRVAGGPSVVATIVAVGDVCVTEAVAAMTMAAAVGIGIRVVALVEVTANLPSALGPPPPPDPRFIGSAWCSPAIISSDIWSSIGRSFPVFGYRERWGSTPWETLCANKLDRFSLLSALHEAGLSKNPGLISSNASLGSEGDMSFSGGVPFFDCPEIVATPIRSRWRANIHDCT